MTAITAKELVENRHQCSEEYKNIMTLILSAALDGKREIRVEKVGEAVRTWLYLILGYEFTCNGLGYTIKW